MAGQTSTLPFGRAYTVAGMTRVMVDDNDRSSTDVRLSLRSSGFGRRRKNDSFEPMRKAQYAAPDSELMIMQRCP
jgi:hypothetical protein